MKKLVTRFDASLFLVELRLLLFLTVKKCQCGREVEHLKREKRKNVEG